MRVGQKYLGIIPARSGSKRLPHKNILEMAGKPLISWTIEAALSAKKLSSVIVSTDDEGIAAVAREYGAEVPFLRPSHLGGDEVTTYDVVEDLLQKVDEPKNIVLLQPTSPLRTADDIDQAISLYEKKSATAVIGVCEVDHPVEWSNFLPKDNNMDNFIHSDIKNKRHQDLPARYRINGAVYIIDTESFLSDKSFIPEKGTYAYRMNRENSVDIDEKLDFLLAELILQTRM